MEPQKDQARSWSLKKIRAKWIEIGRRMLKNKSVRWRANELSNNLIIWSSRDGQRMKLQLIELVPN